MTYRTQCININYSVIRVLNCFLKQPKKHYLFISSNLDYTLDTRLLIFTPIHFVLGPIVLRCRGKLSIFFFFFIMVSSPWEHCRDTSMSIIYYHCRAFSFLYLHHRDLGGWICTGTSSLIFNSLAPRLYIFLAVKRWGNTWNQSVWQNIWNQMCCSCIITA